MGGDSGVGVDSVRRRARCGRPVSSVVPIRKTSATQGSGVGCGRAGGVACHFSSDSACWFARVASSVWRHLDFAPGHVLQSPRRSLARDSPQRQGDELLYRWRIASRSLGSSCPSHQSLVCRRVGRVARPAGSPDAELVHLPLFISEMGCEARLAGHLHGGVRKSSFNRFIDILSQSRHSPARGDHGAWVVMSPAASCVDNRRCHRRGSSLQFSASRPFGDSNNDLMQEEGRSRVARGPVPVGSHFAFRKPGSSPLSGGAADCVAEKTWRTQHSELMP